ncbi:MAG: ABC transporter substrate-binding protein [Sphaerochaetaceae bacterium]|nr:ABC transporter substrate-binding protein [Sphaerochaetaceae bacterium]
MKKYSAILLIAAITVFCFTGCTKNAKTAEVKETVTEETIFSAGEKMTEAELLEKAKGESGDFIVYGNTSRIASAVQGFVQKYGSQLGLSDSNAVGTKMNDADIYTTLLQEYMGSSAKGASLVMIQDGAQLQTYRSGTDILVNFVPASMKGVVAENDLVPLVHQYINKLFIWNNIGTSGQVISNVWQLTEPQWKNKVFFKNPTTEQVNMNFLVMCTSDAWASKLADAYKEYFGKDISLGSYKNAGYKWVAEFIANCNFSISSDTTICKEMAKPDSKGCTGLFVLSKFRDVDAKIKGNLSVGAWQEKAIKPFAGFMYPMYVQLTSKANRPYTAMLFTDYLMNSEGFLPWGKDIGAYSTNPNVPVNEKDGDKPITFWKECLVAEDADFIRVNKTAVTDFVNEQIAKK